MRDLALRVLPAAANNDGEFRLAARMCSGDVVLVSGSGAVRITVRDGVVSEALASAADAPAMIRIVGDADGWEKMLRPAPPPFYQDLYGAAAHHGFRIEGAIEDVGPYYAALRRLIEILRSQRTAGGDADAAVR